MVNYSTPLTWQAGQSQPTFRFLSAPASATASDPAPAPMYPKRFMTQQRRRKKTGNLKVNLAKLRNVINKKASVIKEIMNKDNL